MRERLMNEADRSKLSPIVLRALELEASRK
jgi:hypothetical protein